MDVLCRGILKIWFNICTVVCYMQKYPWYANICKINYSYSFSPRLNIRLEQFLIITFNDQIKILLLGFTTLFNIWGHQGRFRHRAWKVQKILLRGSNVGLRFFYVPWIYDTGPMVLLPFRRKLYSGFLRSEKNPSTPAGIESANLGFRGEYDNHWTTGVNKNMHLHMNPHSNYQYCQPARFTRNVRRHLSRLKLRQIWELVSLSREEKKPMTQTTAQRPPI